MAPSIDTSWPFGCLVAQTLSFIANILLSHVTTPLPNDSDTKLRGQGSGVNDVSTSDYMRVNEHRSRDVRTGVELEDQNSVEYYLSARDSKPSFIGSEDPFANTPEDMSENRYSLDGQTPLSQTHDRGDSGCDAVYHHALYSFCHLPMEVKTMILECLNTESTIASRVYEDPHRIIDHEGRMTGDEVTYDLKNASCVSKEWRVICFPLLFRFLSYKPQIDYGDPYERPPVYDIETFLSTSKTVPLRKPICKIVEGLTVLAVKVSLREWHRHMQDEVVAVGHGRGTPFLYYIDLRRDGKLIWRYPDWIKEFWGSILKQLDPLRVTLLGRPWDAAFLLGSLMSPCFNDTARRTAFHMERPQTQDWPQPHTEEGFTVAYMRSWTHILVNDGHPKGCSNCSLFMSNLFCEGPPNIDRFTYINNNPFTITPQVMNQLLPAPCVDLIIGPPASASPLEVGEKDTGICFGTKRQCLTGAEVNKNSMRGKTYGMISRMLVAWARSDFPVLKMSRFRIQSGADDGGKEWREFVRMVMWKQGRDERARRWMEDGEGWLVKMRDLVGN